VLAELFKTNELMVYISLVLSLPTRIVR